MEKELSDRISALLKNRIALVKEIDEKLSELSQQAYDIARDHIPSSVLSVFDEHPDFFVSRSCVICDFCLLEIPIPKPLPANTGSESFMVTKIEKIVKEYYMIKNLKNDL